MRPDLPTNGQPAEPARPDRRPPLIPPHIAWPGFVVLLLLMSITAAVVTVVAANSDGGAQVVQDSPYSPGPSGPEADPER
jgi:hypothetical protein